MEGFSIKIDYYPSNNNIVIIKLIGYVDQSNSHQIEKVIFDLIQSKKQKFIFDLSELIYMSSAGWGIFIGEIKSVRDVGGDIKVASMSPEIYDVFQVLEFYHILEDYSTVDEAVNSFFQNGNGESAELIRTPLSPVEDDFQDIAYKKPSLKSEKDETKSPDKVKKDSKTAGIIDYDSGKKSSQSKVTPSEPTASGIEIDIAKLPLTERIKKIVAIYPLLNVRQIRKMLQHEKFGSVKISSLKVYRILRVLNLHTKVNRYRYYRSV